MFFKKKTAKAVADKLMNVQLEQRPDQPDRSKWYRRQNFPLVPVWWTKPADKHNTKKFGFEWLFLNLWSSDSFEFELAFQIDPGHWGIGFTGHIPYVRIVCALRPPRQVVSFAMRYLWRKSPQQIKDYKDQDAEVNQKVELKV